MSLTSTTVRNDYTGNGATGTYPYTFRIFEETDIVAIVADLTGTETTLVLTTDYTVTGVGDENGTIVLVEAGQDWMDGSGNLKTGYTLVIKRIRPLTQLEDIRNQGDFFPETHEDAFDHGIMIDQQLQEQIDRSLTLSPTTPTTVSATLPVPEADAPLGWADDGLSIVNNPRGAFKAGVDIDATPDYLGATGSTGVLRVSSNFDYSDGGDFVTIDLATAVTITNLTVTDITIGAVTIDEFSTDGTLSGNSDTALPTEQAVKTYVDAQIVSQDEFTELTDTPASYATFGTYLVAVNAGETALEFIAQTTIDHDTLTNFVANEHIDHTAVTLTAGAGLTGGGDISASRTFDVGAGTGITVNANDIAVSADYSVISGNDAATDVTGAELENLTDGSNADALHTHSTVTTFLGLTDTPGSYAGSGLLFVRVNAGETGLEFAAAAGAANTLDGAYDEGGAGVGRSITADSGAVEITVPDTSNNVGFIVNQNDSTNNPVAVQINNAGSGLSLDVQGDVDIDGKLTVSGLIDPTGLVLDEQATVPGGAPGAGKGTFWVKNDAPSQPYFTDDAGTDYNLLTAGPGGNTLDEAYDQGGAGAGRTITADSGAVQIDSSGANRGLYVNHSGTDNAVRIDGGANITTNSVLNIVGGTTQTSGNIVSVGQSSDSDTQRAIMLLSNTSTLADAVTALEINHDSTGGGNAITIDTEVTTGSGIVWSDPNQISTGYGYYSAGFNGLTTGSIMYLESDSADASVRNLFFLINNNSAASGARCMRIQQDADAQMINFDGPGVASASAIRMDIPNLTSGSGINIVADSTALTSANVLNVTNTANSTAWTGSLANFSSLNSDTSTRNLVQIINDSSSATGTTCLYVRDDATGVGAASVLFDFDGTGTTQLGFQIDSELDREALYITSEITNQAGVRFIFDSLTSGTGLAIQSNSGVSTTSGQLVNLLQDNAASAACCLRARQDGDGLLVDLTQNGNNSALKINGAATEDQWVVNISNANSLTTRGIARFESGATSFTDDLVEITHTGDNGANVANLLNLANDNGNSTGIACLRMQQDADNEFIRFTGSSAGATTSDAQSTLTTPGSIVGFVKVNFNGVGNRWIAVYSNPS